MSNLKQNCYVLLMNDWRLNTGQEIAKAFANLIQLKICPKEHPYIPSDGPIFVLYTDSGNLIH
jgi:hypothetical protein